MFFSIRGDAADQFQTHHGSSVARREVAVLKEFRS
jgi:hypothetical protein